MVLRDFLQELKVQIPAKETQIQDIAEEVYGGPEGLEQELLRTDEARGEEMLPGEEGELELEDELGALPGARKARVPTEEELEEEEEELEL